MAEAGRIGGIFIYPVKSCRGIAVQRATIWSRGFRWDREWMVVDARGRMQTQRVEPRLALVETGLPSGAYEEPLPAGAALRLTAPGMEPLYVPLEPDSPRPAVERVSVWGWAGGALDEGPLPTAWLSRYLGKPVRLVRFDEARVARSCGEEAPGFTTGFADAFPFLVISKASLEALNRMVPSTPLPINRFRPNLFVEGDGVEAYEEDTWRKFKVGDLIFYGVKPCSRCKVTTIDQSTGLGGVDPLVVLRTFRAGQQLAPAAPKMRNQVYFGMNAVCEDSRKLGSRRVVSVGDAVTVLEKDSDFGFSFRMD